MDFPSLTSIDHSCLSECHSLKSLSVTRLGSVTRVGFNFLHNCMSLSTVDLSSMRSLTTVGNCFLLGKGLTTVDLRSLIALERLEATC